MGSVETSRVARGRWRVGAWCGVVAAWVGCAPIDDPEGERWVDDVGEEAPPHVDPPRAEGACAPELGLFADDACQVLRPGVRPFTPQFPLWSDGTRKSRFLYLPAGATLDVQDPDAWVFPVGAKLWKHFDAVDGTRLETRVLVKVAAGTGEAAWRFETYA